MNYSTGISVRKSMSNVQIRADDGSAGQKWQLVKL